MGVITNTHEVKVQVPAKRLFTAVVVEGNHLLPKIAPKAIKSIDILQGDGGAGTIRQINFPDGAPFIYIKEKIEAVDKENLVIKYHVFESGMFGDKLEAIHSVIKYEDSADGGCIVKMTTDHHTKGDAQFTEEDHKASKAFGQGILTLVEEYLVAHPDVCA